MGKYKALRKQAVSILQACLALSLSQPYEHANNATACEYRIFSILVQILKVKIGKLTLAKQKTIYEKEYRRTIDSLKTYRKHIGLTQTQLAEKLGIPQYDISKIENFVRRLDVAELDRWLEAMEIEYSVVDKVCELLQPKLWTVHSFFY